MNNKVLISVGDGYFILKGDLNSLKGDRRLFFALSTRLKSLEGNSVIKIPFQNNDDKIEILKKLQDLLEAYNIANTLSDSAQKELEHYDLSQKKFEFFSEKARKIRNNEFSQDKELSKGFQRFKLFLKDSLIEGKKFYPLQVLSAYHMAFAQNVCNFSVPGTGKTLIVYGAYTYLNSLPFDDPCYVDKILVIGPISSFIPWEDEYHKFFGRNIESEKLPGDTLSTKKKKKQYLYSKNPKELTLISHAGINNLQKGILSFLRDNKTMVVIDEAHKFKNKNGIGGRAIVEIAKLAKARIILTGTPIPNGYEDLYNLFQFLYPFKFEDILNIHYEQMKNLTKNDNTADSNDSVKRLIDNIKPYFVRIRKSDISCDLPEVKSHNIEVTMDVCQKEIYDFIEAKYVKSFRKNPSGTVKDVLNKAKLIRLRQAATNPSLLSGILQGTLENSKYGEIDPNNEFVNIDNKDIDISKLDIAQKVDFYKKTNQIPPKFFKIKHIIDNVLKNKKVIIWTIFIKNAEDLQRYLSENNIASRLLIGRIPQDIRGEIVRKFNNPNNFDFRVIIANPFCVGESISLHHGCSNAIYLERDYNASNFIQSQDRIHRMGSDLNKNIVVNYYYLISKHSIDEIIDKKLLGKIKRMEKVINEDIPLFKIIDDNNETEIINMLIENHGARRI